MYSGEAVTVIVKHPLPFERYFLDYTSGQATLSPDVTSSIIQGLVPSLGKLSFGPFAKTLPPADPCAATKDISAQVLLAGSLGSNLPVFQSCVSQLAQTAIGIYQKLEPFVAPDSITPNGISQNSKLSDLTQPITGFIQSESVLSGAITTISGGNLKSSAPDASAMTELGELQKLMDAVATDLLGYSQRIADLGSFTNGSQDCATLIELTSDDAKGKPQCVVITSRTDDPRIYERMVTRTITYSLDTLNLVSISQEAAPDPTKKKALGSIALNFADSHTKFAGLPTTSFRWEASAGVFFSMLPDRSFYVKPTYTNLFVSNYTVTQSILRPTVVPFAAANYRLTNDLGWTRWKSDIYWTAAVGVNPNTVSADFATGPSISWRALMLSGFCHFGHDVHLTQGFYPTQSLGASFTGTLPSHSFWTEAFAFGVSVRVPAITGR